MFCRLRGKSDVKRKFSIELIASAAARSTPNEMDGDQALSFNFFLTVKITFITIYSDLWLIYPSTE